MKMKDILTKIFGDLDADIDLTSESTSKVDSVKEKDSGVEKQVEPQKEDETTKQEEETLKIPSYDAKTGLFDLGSTDNEELKAVLKIANDTVKNNNNKVIIEKAVNDKLSTTKLNKGITAEAVKTLLNMSNVKVNSEGAVTGLDEAFESLKTSQSGLFEQIDNNKNNPLYEGFNPQSGVAGNTVPNSFAEAFSMMAQ